LISQALPASPPARPRPFYRHLYVQVLAAIVLGAAIGHLWPTFGASLKPLGDGFIKLVKMIIAPVIFLTITTGIAGMRDLEKVGRVAVKALAYFLTFSTLALVIGLVVANVVQPGAAMHIDPASLDAKSVAAYTAKAHDQTVTGFLLHVIPDTVVSAFAEGEILQVLFFSILFGVSLAIIGDRGQPVVDLLEAVS
jgi:aerobic C4-dicarboxylate transport protein